MTGPLYIGYHFEISPIDPGSEILMAELGFAGFDSFIETPKGVLAYIKKKDQTLTLTTQQPPQINPSK